jgi:ferric-dicitrate binding protein FerR (iron transport regulator)
MTIDRFWYLLSKRRCGEASAPELKELEDILLTHPEWKNTADIISNLKFQSTVFEDNEDAEQAFETHLTRMKKADVEFGDIKLNYDESEPGKKGNSKKWLLAAMLAITLILFFVFKNLIFTPERKNGSQPTLSQVSTKPGSKTQIQLPDGSVVRLNSSSTLTYDKNFGKNIREVNLTGEAFFDVTKDSSRPFIIHTNVIDVKVLGTAFNVKSYPGDPNTETSLIRGKVEVTVKNRSNEKIYLEPNEKLVVSNNAATINSRQVDQREQSEDKTNLVSKPIYSVQHLTYYPVDSTIIETSWVDNKLVFQENETFREVALKMERWYGVKINFADEEVARIRPFGSFTNETISQALSALHESFGFNYKISGNEITISNN